MGKESVGTVQVQWLINRDSSNLGVVGLDQLPPYTAGMMRKLADLNKRLKTILFPSKAESVIFEGIILKQRGIPVVGREVTERSRFTVLFPKNDEPVYLLLNRGAIEEGAIYFLLDLFSTTLAKADEHKEALDSLHKDLLGTFAEIFFSYTKKMGIPFVYADEMTRKFIDLMVQNIQITYLECSALRDMVSVHTSTGPLASYLQYKIESSFETFDYEMRFQLTEVYQTLEKMLLVATLMSAISEHKPLSMYLENILRKNNNEFKRRYSELPDLLRSVETLFSSREKIVFLSYAKYVESIVEVMRIAFCQIEARYVSLGESIALVDLGDLYLEALERGDFPVVPGIGTVDNYIELLERIFGTDDIYPEVRIVVGIALRQTLLSMALMGYNRDAFFPRLVECSKEFWRLVETGLPEVLRKNGSLPGFTGSPITYEDGVEQLLAVSSVARSLGDTVAEQELRQLAEDAATRHNLPSIKAHLFWAQFVESQDFGHLFRIHEIVPSIDFDKFPHLRYILLPIDLLVQALLYKDDIESLLAKAQDLVLDGLSVGATHSLNASQSNQTTQAMCFVLDTFKWLLISLKSRSALRKAYLSSLALKDVVAKQDRLHILALKTEILYKLTTRDFRAVNKSCEELSTYPDPQGMIKLYVGSVSRWVKICETEPERRYLFQKDFRYDGEDIWLQILYSHVRECAEEDLSKSMVGSRALVFAEGVTDVLVLGEFTTKLFPEARISFVDLEGYTNYQYYVEAKITKTSKVPCYLVLDGDVSARKKGDLAKRLESVSLGRNAVFVLHKNSIEDYLLVPRAIKKACPSLSLSIQDMENYIQENARKKNKKALLQSLFKTSGTGTYNKDCAKRIAHEIEKHEIDSELVEILRKIAA